MPVLFTGCIMHVVDIMAVTKISKKLSNFFSLWNHGWSFKTSLLCYESYIIKSIKNSIHWAVRMASDMYNSHHKWVVTYTAWQNPPWPKSIGPNLPSHILRHSAASLAWHGRPLLARGPWCWVAGCLRPEWADMQCFAGIVRACVFCVCVSAATRVKHLKESSVIAGKSCSEWGVWIGRLCHAVSFCTECPNSTSACYTTLKLKCIFL